MPFIPSTKDRLIKKLEKLKTSAVAEIKKLESLPADQRSNININSSIREIEKNFNEIIRRLQS